MLSNHVCRTKMPWPTRPQPTAISSKSLRSSKDKTRRQMDLNSLTIPALRASLAEKKHSAAQLVTEFYQKIQAEDPAIHAFLALSEERAMAQARRMDDLAGKGAPLPKLAGVPVAIKDVMVTKGVRTTAG